MQTATAATLPASEDVRRAVARFLVEAKAAAGTRLRSVIVYGSVARGEATTASDVDLLIEWDGSEKEARDVLTPLATRVFADTGILFSLYPLSTGRLARLREGQTRFIRTVEREGLVVAA